MEAPTDIRAQLRSLSINKNQRPLAAKGSGVSARGIRALLILAVIVCLGVAAYYLGGSLLSHLSTSTTAAGEEVRLMTVTARTQTEAPPIFTAAGKIVSDHRVEVMAKVSGQIVELLFEQGDRVNK